MKSPLAALRERPIPSPLTRSTALDYHSVGIDREDARFHEPLIELSTLGIAGESYYVRSDGGNAPYYRQVTEAPVAVWSRESVARKLQHINGRLSSLGLELFTLDGYRPISCQRALWDFGIAEAKRQLDSPSEEQCIAFAGQYFSNPSRYSESDSSTWPTHLTGGAIDLTIRRIANGELLFMGGIFDDPSELSSAAYYEQHQRPGVASDVEARANRRLLYWLMREEGFANYPLEWWHYDFGTQMWVFNGGDGQRAFYGPASL